MCTTGAAGKDLCMEQAVKRMAVTSEIRRMSIVDIIGS
jgi:hypothetical protein